VVEALENDYYMRYIAGTVYFLHTAYYDLEKLDSVQAK